MPPKKTTGRIVAFDGLRGFAACYVLLNHLQGFIQPHSWLESKLAAFFLLNPSLGSRTLLLISGCVVYRSFLLRPVAVQSFWRQRISRLYFPYLAILAIYLLISVLNPGKSKIPVEVVDAIPMIAANALMIQGLTGYEPIIVQTWTLAYFLVFYFTCPLVVKLCNWAGISEAQRITLLVQASFASRFVLGEGSPWTFILVGMLSAELLFHIKTLSWLGQWALLGVSWIALSLGETPVTILCWILIANANESIFRKVLQGSFPRWIGARGYSLYLTHSIVLNLLAIAVLPAIHPFEESSMGYWTLHLAVLSAALCVATLFYRYVENPMLLRFSRSGTSIPVPVPVFA